MLPPSLVIDRDFVLNHPVNEFLTLVRHTLRRPVSFSLPTTEFIPPVAPDRKASQQLVLDYLKGQKQWINVRDLWDWTQSQNLFWQVVLPPPDDRGAYIGGPDFYTDLEHLRDRGYIKLDMRPRGIFARYISKRKKS